MYNFNPCQTLDILLVVVFLDVASWWNFPLKVIFGGSICLVPVNCVLICRISIILHTPNIRRRLMPAYIIKKCEFKRHSLDHVIPCQVHHQLWLEIIFSGLFKVCSHTQVHALQSQVILLSLIIFRGQEYVIIFDLEWILTWLIPCHKCHNEPL